MHDKYGHSLGVGDNVLIPARIKSTTGGPDYCNVEVETTERMPPDGTTSTYHLNSKQVLKAKLGKGGVLQPLGETLGPGKEGEDDPPPRGGGN